MLSNLFLGIATMALCLILQIALLSQAVVYYARHQARPHFSPFLGTLSVLNGVLVLLLCGNLGQVAVWGLVFQLIGEFDDYATAFYHSAVNFSTLGYGDIVMSERRRVLGPLQAMNGVLMIGISTAIFMTTLRDAVKNSSRHWRKEKRQALRRLMEASGN